MEKLRIPPGSQVRLARFDPGDTSAFPGSKQKALRESARNLTKLSELQELLYACHGDPILVVLQAVDTGGKDGTIRHVFRGLNPQSVKVAEFRYPTAAELDHDFLWRVHSQVPGKGEITIFNRSHYEDVLVARVHRLVPKEVWKQRYRSINEFERTLFLAGTTVLKFFLHISEEEQRSRLQERLDDPTKHWKINPADLEERSRWSLYTPAIEEMLERTSTPWAPWYLVPANKKWFRNWAVSQTLVEALEDRHLKWPPLAAGLKVTRIP